MSQDQKDKISKANKGRPAHNNAGKNPDVMLRRNFISMIAGPYTPVYANKCASAGVIFYSQQYKKYHPDTAMQERKLYAQACKFDFLVGDYPGIEGLDLLKRLGMYHPVKNPTGVSRDHIFSVSDGWKDKVDPAIMRHPANCRFIPHRENQSKKTKSLIPLEELRIRIGHLDGTRPH